MGNAKVLIRQSFKPLTKEKKLEVWNKVKARIATGEYCEITANEYKAIVNKNRLPKWFAASEGLGQTVEHFGIGRFRYPAEFIIHNGKGLGL